MNIKYFQLFLFAASLHKHLSFYVAYADYRVPFYRNLLSNNKFHSTGAILASLCSLIHGFEGWQVDKVHGLKILVLSLCFLF